MFWIAIAMLTSKRGIEKVTRVNLYAWFVGKHLQHYPRLWTVQRGCHRAFVGLSVVPSIQAPVMVETMAKRWLLMFLLNGVGLRKSMGVPLTFNILPVGI